MTQFLRNRVNVAILGRVSVGKSTLNNALFVEQLSDCHMKRTTAVPQIYHELTTRETKIMKGDEKANDDELSPSDIKHIRDENRARNKEVMDASLNGTELKLDDIKSVEYVVPKITDIFDMVSDDHGNDVVLTIYDMPGLNDAKTKDVYFEYIRKTKANYDLFIFVTDIENACNTHEEIEIIKLISECVKSNGESGVMSRVMVVINKCDDLEFDENGIPIPVDEEQCEMLGQIMTVIGQHIPIYKFACVSCEDAFIYRMANAGRFDELDDKYISKLGCNELGKRKWKTMTDPEKKSAVKKLLDDTDTCTTGLKLSGFANLRKQLKQILTKKTQLQFVLNRYIVDLNAHELNHLRLDISDDLTWFRMMEVRLHMVNLMFKKKAKTHFSEYKEHLTKYMLDYEWFIASKCCIEKSPSWHVINDASKLMRSTPARLSTFCASSYNKITKLLNTQVTTQLTCVIQDIKNSHTVVLEALRNLKEVNPDIEYVINPVDYPYDDIKQLGWFIEAVFAIGNICVLYGGGLDYGEYKTQAYFNAVDKIFSDPRGGETKHMMLTLIELASQYHMVPNSRWYHNIHRLVYKCKSVLYGGIYDYDLLSCACIQPDDQYDVCVESPLITALMHNLVTDNPEGWIPIVQTNLTKSKSKKK